MNATEQRARDALLVRELGFGGGRLRRGEVLGVAGDLLERLGVLAVEAVEDVLRDALRRVGRRG